MEDPFRVYDSTVDPFDEHGYPVAWQVVKHLVRAQAENRCVRCGHPYAKGDGEWSACDEHCAHPGPLRTRSSAAHAAWCYYGMFAKLGWKDDDAERLRRALREGKLEVEAQWRVLTVHHLDGVKANCRWWNLVSLCQRCHLLIQRKVALYRPWPWPHTEWFQPYAAAFYAFKYLEADLSREETMERLVPLLALGQEREAEERMPV